MDRESRKIEKEDLLRKEREENEKQKKNKRDAVPPFEVGNQNIYRGQYWRKVFENEDNYFLDHRFYEDLIMEIDSLGLYIQFEKLIQIREGIEMREKLELERKLAK